MQNKSRAFTLIELLVVVLIIGILAAVAVPQYQVAVLRSRLANVKVMTNSLAQAEEVYYLANGSYTNNFDELDVNTPQPTSSATQAGRSSRTFENMKCELSTGGKYAVCTYHVNGVRVISNQIYFLNSTEPQNRRNQCITPTGDLTAAANKVCKNDTGKTTPLENNDTLTIWVY